VLVLTNHIHRYCGGRILMDKSPDTFTPGGNPYFVCADCEASTVEMAGHAALCMCGDERLRSHCIHREFAQQIPALAQYMREESTQAEIRVIRVELWQELVGSLPRPAAPEPAPKKNPPLKDKLGNYMKPEDAGWADATERSRYPDHWDSKMIRTYHNTFAEAQHARKLAVAQRDNHFEWPQHLVRANPVLWKLDEHLCQYCDHRILQGVANVGMTPGGNGIHYCSGCGRSSWKMGGQDLCYCGWRLHEKGDAGRGSGMSFVCMPYTKMKERPEWLQAAFLIGQDPLKPYNHRKIGIVPYQVARHLEKTGVPQ
jgi:hypothetical protein